MLRCLGFSVAGWDFQLLVVCGRWLKAEPAAFPGKGVSSCNRACTSRSWSLQLKRQQDLCPWERSSHAQLLVVSWTLGAGAGIAQSCKSFLRSWLHVNMAEEGLGQKRGWGRVFQSARHQHPTFSVLVSHQDELQSRTSLSGREKRLLGRCWLFGCWQSPCGEGLGRDAGAVGGRWHS